MDLQLALVYALAFHGVIFVVLFVIWLVALRSGSSTGQFSLRKSKSLLEQRLVMEAISAYSAEKGLKALLSSIGKHAAEMTGFKEWIIWQRQNDEFAVVDAEIRGGGQGLAESIDTPLYRWVTQNATPVKLRKTIRENARSAHMRRALEHLSNGIMIPFVDGARVHGFEIVGGQRISRERRSDQFLSLFGAFAAIIIKNRQLHEQERMLQLRQERIEKLASMGKLAAGLAHEIRNPLGFIKVSVQHIYGKYDFGKADSQTLDDIVDEINRINHHVEELLMLGRIDPQSFAPVDLKEVIQRAARLAESKAKASSISLTLEIGDQPAVVYGNEELLWQLILNLILNGIEAMDSGGELSISMNSTGNNAVVEVGDRGGGIDEKIASKIFDPFFTTKEKGTGLGLSVAFNVAQAHDGTLELLETGPNGSRFKITLPLTN